jgi:type VI secretion system protein VasJ
MTSLSEEFRGAGEVPLPEDAPDPAWVRDDSPEFAAINLQIASFDSLSADEEPDWLALIRACGDVVRTKSKDLLAISYLCRALFERERYEGLAAGLQVLDDVVEHHWEAAFPPLRRAKRRGNEIAWLIDKLVNPVTLTKPEDGEAEAVKQAAECLLGLERKLGEKLDDNAPIFRELRDPLVGYRDAVVAAEQARAAEQERQAAERERQEAERQAPEPSAAGSAPLPAPAGGEPAAAAAAAPTPIAAPAVGAIGSDKDVRAAVKEIRRAVKQLAQHWRANKLSDPRPYVIARYAAWLDVSAVPPVPLPGPSKERVAACERMLAEGDHRGLIDYAEDVFLNPDAPPNCHWIDCHRYTAAALAALGDDYAAARQAVIRALRHYLASFPAALDMSFVNEVPYADGQTRAWIRSEVMVAEPGGGSGAGEGAKQDAVDAAVAEAQALAAKGDKSGAIAIFQRYRGSAANAREAFALGLEQARFCVELGHHDVAVALLESLREKTDYHHLDEWEPAYSVETLRLLLQSSLKAAGADKSRIGELQGRLARLDPVAAIEATSGRRG